MQAGNKTISPPPGGLGGLTVTKPVTVYIRFTQSVPKTFILYKEQYDRPGESNVYYFRKLAFTPRIKMNIPDAGVYYSNTPFEVIKTVPIETPEMYPVLPPAERNRLKPITYKISDEIEGVTPARIFTDTGLIEVAPSFFKLPITVRLFLLLHEQSHFFYVTEQYCDMMAMVNFLRQGYNQSTAYYSLEDFLSRTKQNVERLKFMFNQIQKTQKELL